MDDLSELRSQYSTRRANILEPIAAALQKHLRNQLRDIKRIDQITARAKDVDSFMDKAVREKDEGGPKYPDPLNEIQDQIGVRVVTFYLDDVDTVSQELESYYHDIENRRVEPDSTKEFDYVGKHYILILPRDVVAQTMERSDVPRVFELQLKTLFQHAWGEANHDLGYKPRGSLESEEKRKIAFAAAQAWGADRMFQELHRSR